MEYILIFLFIYVVLFFIQKEFKNQRNKFEEKIKELSHEIDAVRGELNEVRDVVEYQNLTESEKEEIAFENAKDISINFFEKLEKGQIVSLVSGSYYNPSENIYISKFVYKHDHIDRENKTRFGWEVHGYEKFFEEDEWSSCTLLAHDTGCSTSSCSGTVKKMNS